MTMNHHGSCCTYCSLEAGALLWAPHRSGGQVQPVQTMGSGSTKSKHTAVLLSSICHFIWQLILVLNSDRAQGSNLRAGWSLSEDRSELPAELQCFSNSHADYKTYTPLGLSTEPSHVLRILVILQWTEPAILPRSSSVFLHSTPNWEGTARQDTAECFSFRFALVSSRLKKPNPNTQPAVAWTKNTTGLQILMKTTHRLPKRISPSKSERHQWYPCLTGSKFGNRAKCSKPHRYSMAHINFLPFCSPALAICFFK